MIKNVRIGSTATVISRALGSTLLTTGALLLVATPSFAQTEETAPQAGGSGEEIVITGSRLVRTDLTAPSPTTVMSSEDIALSGNVSLEKTLNEFPQLAAGNTSSANIGGGSGILTANLRGLGSTRTLVLVNGRRFVAASSAGEVDLASIPDALIKRAEIITGGASAVYGSDAIAGAVNFILNDTFEGLTMTAQTGITQYGDAASHKIDFTWGTQSDRSGVVLAATWAKQDQFDQSDRSWSRIPLGEVNGALVYAGSGNVPGTRVGLTAAQRASIVGVNMNPGANCTSVTGITFDSSGTPQAYCAPESTYNYAPYMLLQRPQDRISLSALAHYDVTDRIQLYGETYYVNARNEYRLAPDSFTPVTPGAPSQTLLVPQYATNPGLTQSVRNFFINNAAIFDPDGDGTAAVVGSGRRAEEVGTRDAFFERNSLAVTLGARGDMDLGAGKWNWDTFFQYHRNRTDSRYEGVVSQSRLSLGLNTMINSSGQVVCQTQTLGCVPVNIFGEGAISPEAAAFISPSRVSHDTFERYVAGGSLSGVLFNLPAGPVSMALGAEYREDRYNFVPSPQDIAGEYGPSSQAALSGKFDVKEVFGELRVPLLSDMPFIDTLAIEGAARYSDYSTIGGVFTWKLGGEYAPVHWFRFRGAYNQAIRAPNIAELYGARTIGYVNGAVDFCARTSSTNDTRSAELKALCVATGVPAGDINTFEQQALGMNQESGGNPNLREEKSKTYTIGAVVSPPFLPGLNLTVDYWNVEIEDAITSINNAQTMAECAASLSPSSVACQNVLRLPSGQIDYVRVALSNIGAMKASGLDVQADYRMGLPSVLSLDGDASLSLQAVGSWMFERSLQTTSASGPLDCAGHYAGGCSSGSGGFIIPDFKLNVSARYTSGPVTLTMQGRMIGAIKPYSGVTTVAGDIDPVWYFDLTSNVDVTGGLSVFGGINNLFNKKPPIFGTTYVGDANTDVTLYDIMGRRFFIGATMKF
ncbi:TonB-dependent receptor-like protein [Sphingobium sp. SYK-6]|nr:TonB-dependent receptor-like protein [Sphingobium sp. SYK-6]